MSKTMIIGIRARHSEVGTVFPNIRRKVGGGRDTLLRAAKTLGLKKTENGQPLEFYIVDEQQYRAVVDDRVGFMRVLKGQPQLRPLVEFDPEGVTKAFNTTNAEADRVVAKLRKTHANDHQALVRANNSYFDGPYEVALRDRVAAVGKKLKDDEGTKRAKRATTDQLPHKVGDWIEVTVGWREYSYGKIKRITKTMFIVDVPYLGNGHPMLLVKMLDLKASVRGDSQDYEVRVPLTKANRKRMPTKEMRVTATYVSPSSKTITDANIHQMELVSYRDSD